jgi:hypothetical protein
MHKPTIGEDRTYLELSVKTCTSFVPITVTDSEQRCRCVGHTDSCYVHELGDTIVGNLNCIKLVLSYIFIEIT